MGGGESVKTEERGCGKEKKNQKKMIKTQKTIFAVYPTAFKNEAPQKSRTPDLHKLT